MEFTPGDAQFKVLPGEKLIVPITVKSVAVPPTLKSARDLEKAAAALTAKCRVMRSIHARVGVPALRDYDSGFSGIAKIVTGQQLSAASANAIWARVSAAVQPFEAHVLLDWPDTGLAGLGLSKGKIKTLKALARAVLQGLDMARLAKEPDNVIVERLTAIHGIGPWTADIYLLFALRRADAFPPGDLALQIAAQRHFKLKSRPSPAELGKLAERWRPWRGVAARLLWADYGAARTAKSPPAPPKTERKNTVRTKFARNTKK